MARSTFVFCGLWIVGLLTSTVLIAQHVTHQISDGTLWIGIDQARGGIVTDFQVRVGDARRRSIIDHGDLTGREVQAALYQAAYDPKCFPCRSACFWGWNAVQGGNACQQSAPATVIDQTGLKLVTSVVPLQWNDRLGESKVVLRQTLEIVQPFVLKMDYSVVNHEVFAWGDVPHELPVVYLRKSFAVRAFAYQGEQPFTYDKPTTLAIPTLNLRTTEPWIAWVDATGVALALYVPGKYSDWAASTVGDANLMQAWQHLRLQPEEIGAVRAYLVAGESLTTVRMRIYILEGR